MARSLAAPGARGRLGLSSGPWAGRWIRLAALGGWRDAGAAAALSVGLSWNLLRDGLPVSLDSNSQYWPWYAYLGNALRSGRIPAWNPSMFGGAPFTADPLSGWTYLPAMSIFALLPPGAAIATFVCAHFLLAALATSSLARALGLPTSAAVLAGALYAGSGFFQFESVAAQPYVAVAAWLPVSLLGAEKALTANQTQPRLAWWCLAGFALSQIIAIWPGQGAYYAALTFGAWTLARAMTAPQPLRTRLLRAPAHPGVPLLIAVALAAAGVLPRLELQSVSNLANGYAAQDQVGGWQPADFARLATPGPWDVGIVTLGLALAGLLTLTRRPRRLRVPSGPFVVLAAMWLAVLVLAATMRTPLHGALFAILPGFAGLHAHIPERILVVGYLAPALLAGLGFTALRARFAGDWRTSLVAAAACLELLVAGRLAVDRQIGVAWDPLTRVADFNASLTPSGAASFLLAQPTPFRYVGYDASGADLPYTQRFADPRTVALLANNRAVSLGLQDIQGYDAVHLARFDAYLKALNAGQTQNYHDGQVFQAGLRSPLLDLLNVRFLVLPANSSLTGDAVVFQDDQNTVVERPTALPRGLLVHHVRRATRDEALQLVAAAVVDPRQTALLEEPLADPPSAADGSADQISVVSDTPEASRWRVTTNAQGVLVMSEVAYPAWSAYVDGQRTPMLTADGLVRAVAIPAGEHVVDVRYESATLNVGIAISLLSLLAIGGVFANLARRRR